MTRQQEARRYIDRHGVDKAQRLIDNVVCNAEFYKERTGSYYSTYDEYCISLKHLKVAIRQYNYLKEVESRFEDLLKDWRE